MGTDDIVSAMMWEDDVGDTQNEKHLFLGIMGDIQREINVSSYDYCTRPFSV
jgi:hypothetical protein